MTAITALLCVLMSVVIFERAYRIAKKHVALLHRVNVLEDSYKEATDHIAKQEEFIISLQQELDFIRRTEEEQSKRERPRAWNPGDPLNTGTRL